jgi:GT2 family glycosyltransferase
MTELSICILTLNSVEYIRKCLKSIQQFPPDGGYEILVADNGSNDGTVTMLQDEYPAVKIILNKENLGFTKPNNQMLRQA